MYWKYQGFWVFNRCFKEVSRKFYVSWYSSQVTKQKEGWFFVVHCCSCFVLWWVLISCVVLFLCCLLLYLYYVGLFMCCIVMNFDLFCHVVLFCCVMLHCFVVLYCCCVVLCWRLISRKIWLFLTVCVFLQLSVNPAQLTVGTMCSVGKGEGEQAVQKQELQIGMFRKHENFLCLFHFLFTS